MKNVTSIGHRVGNLQWSRPPSPPPERADRVSDVKGVDETSGKNAPIHGAESRIRVPQYDHDGDRVGDRDRKGRPGRLSDTEPALATERNFTRLREVRSLKTASSSSF
ncbi:MAG: hypothetical protein AB1486_08840 [Planctomycetota bacterium]